MRIKKIDLSLHRFFEASSILYLALPVAIFFAGWLQPFYAIVAVIILLIGLFFYFKRLQINSDSFSFVKHRYLLIGIVLVVIGWVTLSNIGLPGENHQTSDFNKHNAVLSDLTTYGWPVVYEKDSGNATLVYYIAYYLPAATAGKLFHSTDVAEMSLLPWTILGVILVLYWIFRLLKRVSLGTVILFILFAGIDIVGQLLLRNSEISVYILNIFSHIEGYASIIGANYQGNTSLLFWAPQHAIPAWLIAGIVITSLVERNYGLPIFFVLAIGILWSPMVIIGALPLAVAYVLLMTKKRKFKTILHPVNTVIPLFIVAIFALYFLSGTSEQVLHSMSAHSTASNVSKLIAYTIFIFAEFLLLIILIIPYIKKLSIEWRTITGCCVIFLCLVPLVIYGTMNDIGLRAPIISLFVVFLLVAGFLYQKKNSTAMIWRSCAVLILIALGSISSFVEFNTHITGPVGNTHYWGSINSPNLTPEDAYFAKQYLGDPNSLFSRTIGK